MLTNVANAFENNYSTLQSIYNGLKYVARHFRLISYGGFSQIGSHINKSDGEGSSKGDFQRIMDHKFNFKKDLGEKVKPKISL